MKKVALLTTFFEVSSGYSLVRVAETQLRALIDHGYDPAVLVQKNFKAPDDDETLWHSGILDIRPAVPFLHLTSGEVADFEERVDKVHEGLRQGLSDADVCITHDIILQNTYKEHNVAMRRYAAERPELLWLHWIHSCPTPKDVKKYPANCRYSPPPGYIVYPNVNDLPLAVRTYGLQGMEDRVRPCRAAHALDPLSLWRYDKLTKDLVRKSDLTSGEITAVYPARLDRGKQVEKVVRLLAGVQKAGYETRLLVIDWQSSGRGFQRYIDELLSLSQELGLGGKVNFTSRLDDRCNLGVPPHVVLELMDLTNVYIHPSAVETYSLVCHEALTRGKLLVLNHDFPAMRELYDDTAVYMDFGSDRVKRDYHPNEQAFWNDEAKRLVAEFRNNRVLTGQLKARRDWTPDALWREFEALLYLEPREGSGSWNGHAS